MKLSPAAAIIAFSAQFPSSPAVVMAGSGKTGKIVPSSSNGKLSKFFKSKSKALIKTSAANSYSYSSSMSIDIDTDPPTRQQTVPPTRRPTPRPTVPPTFAPLVCDLTPEERAEQIKTLMSTVSDPITFDDPNSPQSKALDWITYEDAISPPLCPNQIEEGVGCTKGGDVNPMIQRYAMAVFYYATDGDNWDQCSAASDFSDATAVAVADAACNRVVTPFGVPNDRVGDTSTDAWLGPVNECEWGGVACWGADTPNLNLCIDQLDFENDGLSGTLASEIGTLNTLRFLILEEGSIGGTIPPEYGELDRLLILDMDFNQLSGTIPDEIYGIPTLQQLDLNDNELTGTISPTIGDLSSLGFFQIDHNVMSGTIPSEMGLLRDLRIAFLSANDLTGVMPDEVCALRNNTVPPGVLGVLVTDCAGDPPEVVCPCCSTCSGGTQAIQLPIDLTEKLPINFTLADEAMRTSNGTP